MAIRWYDSLKDMQWGKALSAAPAIAERGKALWTRVTNRAKAEAESTTQAPHPGTEARLDRLNEELMASFEVVQAMATQHSELVRAVDVLIARTRVLLRVCALLAAAVVALFVLVLVR